MARCLVALTREMPILVIGEKYARGWVVGPWEPASDIYRS